MYSTLGPSRSVECYSCKMVGTEKRLYKAMHAEPGTSPHDLQALSLPPSSSYGSAPTGCLSSSYG